MHGAIERRVMMVARVGWRTGVGACAVVSTSSCVHYGDKASIEVLPEEDNGSSDRTALWRSRLTGPQWRLPSPFTPWSLSPNRHPPSDPFHHLPELAGRPQGFGSIQPLFRVPVQGFEVNVQFHLLRGLVEKRRKDLRSWGGPKCVIWEDTEVSLIKNVVL